MNFDPVIQNQFTDIINNMYEFEPYFDLILTKEYFKTRGIPIVNEYPLLESSIEKCRNAIRSMKKKKYKQNTLIDILAVKETFTQEIGLNDNPNSFYTINWDIKRLGNLIRKYHLEAKVFPLETIIRRLSRGSVPYIDESVPIRNEPIIAVEYPLIKEIPRILIVDGNYRAVRKFQRGDTTIDVYLIPPKIHYLAMLDDWSKTAYKIHSNCYYIVEYMAGQIPDLKELKKLLFAF